MATDYLELNRAVLEELRRSDPVKYRSLKLYLECQNIYAETGDWDQAAAHWNAWAQERLAERHKLEESGQWKAEKDFFGESVGRNNSVQYWVDDSKVDFSKLAFIPEHKRFSLDIKINKKVIKVILFRPVFHLLIFPIDLSFYESVFFDVVSFWRSKVHGSVIFWETEFQYFCNFRQLTSDGIVSFQDTVFHERAEFHGAEFWGGANFEKVVFGGDAYFPAARFGDDVTFRLAHFKEPVDFSWARFRKKADFSSLHSDKGFSLHGARFRVAPDFNEALFHAPPVLDAMHVAGQLTAKKGKWPLRFRHVPEPKENAKDISRNFRALGKMAHEARDWQNEMEFFAQESRIRRFGLDFPFGEWRGLRGLLWRASRRFGKGGNSFLRKAGLWLRGRVRNGDWCGPHPGRFWFGLIYEKVLRDVYIMH